METLAALLRGDSPHIARWIERPQELALTRGVRVALRSRYCYHIPRDPGAVTRGDQARLGRMRQIWIGNVVSFFRELSNLSQLVSEFWLLRGLPSENSFLPPLLPLHLAPRLSFLTWPFGTFKANSNVVFLSPDMPTCDKF